jgi:AraC-like DNA-binding protein
MDNHRDQTRKAGWGSAEDPLSSVLLDLKLSGTFFCISEFGDPWAVAIEQRDFASFHFVVRGHCWLRSVQKGRRTLPVDLHPGDLVLLPRSPPQVFSSHRQRHGTPIDRLPTWRLGDTASSLRMGKGAGGWLLVCGGFRFEGFVSTTLGRLLPEVLVLRSASSRAIVASALDAMKHESMLARPGSATLMTRLADVVVIHAIRDWIEQADIRAGWLAALKDRHLGPVVAQIHLRPADAWTVESMANIAHLSRSHFSQRFLQVTGEPPMQYLTKVRMQRACEQLRCEQLTVAELAQKCGYESEPAFARAFKRHTGFAPGSLRRTPAGGSVRVARAS